jgi:large subunit ribosomal protein L25
MAEMTVEALPRVERGKSQARQLRRGGQVPAVVYGGAAEPQALSVNPRVIEKLLHSEAGRNAVFTLSIKGHGKASAMIRDWQVEPVKGQLLHVDFLRIALDARLKVKVPVEVGGEAVGVKEQGGILELVQREIEVECLPGDIPDGLALDVTELTIGKGIRVGDLKVDNRKLQILTDPDRVIVHVVAPRALAEEEKPLEEAVPAAAESAEPELIRKRKAEAEAEEEQGKKPAEAEGESG